MNIKGAVLLFSLQGVLTLAASNPQTISTSGEAEIKVEPDLVNILLGVEVRSKDLPFARRRNDELSGLVLAVPVKFGVQNKDVQTDFMQLDIGYEPDGVTVKYYAVRKSIHIALRDIQRFEALTVALLDAGATHLHGVEFRTSELRKHRDQARALAVKAAMEKARDLASAAGRRAGRVTNIAEAYGGGSWYGAGWRGSYGRAMSQNIVQSAGPAGLAAEGGTVALGRISVTASVTMTFELE